MIAEEFSFPIIKSAHLSVLPPLWRIASVNHSDAELEQEENGRKKKIFRRSFSEVEDEITTKGKIVKKAKEEAEEQDEEQEEKMDMLWEDFNEELQLGISSSVDISSSTVSDSDNNCNDNVCGEATEECSSTKEGDLKIPNSCSGLIISTKKKNLELVVNKLKKLFLVHNVARHKNGAN